MRQRLFQQVDVFTRQAYRGNAVAVVLEGNDISDAAMLEFTRWTQLSEATFVLPPTPEGRAAGADYRVRIFCPDRELPFAGHPTLGTCHAWLQAGGQPRDAQQVVQECGAGLVKIQRHADQWAFEAPPLLRSGPLEASALGRMAKGLGLSMDDIEAHAWCDNGPPWQAVLLRSAQQVLAIEPDPATLAGWFVGVIGPHAPSNDLSELEEGGHIDWEVRAFFPGQGGFAEDPVTGSLNAALGQWLIGSGRAHPRYVARQGTRLGRDGRVTVAQQGHAVWVGGDCVTCMTGHVLL